MANDTDDLPETIWNKSPICPHCERPWRETEQEFVTINCSCGGKFEVQRLYICKPLEHKRSQSKD